MYSGKADREGTTGTVESNPNYQLGGPIVWPWHCLIAMIRSVCRKSARSATKIA